MQLPLRTTSIIYDFTSVPKSFDQRVMAFPDSSDWDLALALVVMVKMRFSSPPNQKEGFSRMTLRARRPSNG